LCYDYKNDVFIIVDLQIEYIGENDMNEIKALCKVYLVNTLSNKFVFLFNLVLPTIYFLYKNIRYLSQPKVAFSHQTMMVISYFWAYIIMVTLLNNVIVAIISQRENGFYKQLFFIVGSKWKILTANFLVQLVILNVELLIFNLVVIGVTHNFHISLLIAGMIATFSVAVPVTFISSLLFLLKVKIESINVLVTILLFVLFLTINLPKSHAMGDLLSLLNPITYIVDTSYQLLLFFFNHVIQGAATVRLGIATIIYLVIGWFAISKLTVHSIADRV
jgi:ABC-2 type transport system permease protein